MIKTGNKSGTLAPAMLYVDNDGLRRDRQVGEACERIGSLRISGGGCATDKATGLKLKVPGA